MSLPPRAIYSETDGINSPATRKKYAYYFKKFMDHFDIPNREYLVTLNDPRRIEGLIIQYIKHLAGKGLVYSSIYNHVASILNFFEMNDVILNKRKIHKFIPLNEQSHEDRPYTFEEIQRILKYCDERSRVIFHLMASTGMRIGAIDGLNFGDLTEMPNYGLYQIMVYANSKRGHYYTFCTPECFEAINAYRKYRERYGEVITKDSPLIRDNFDTSMHYHCEHPQRITVKGISSLVGRILLRAGVANSEVMMSHGFRKRYATIMKKCHVEPSDREYLIGHKSSRGLDNNYDRSTPDDRLQEYLKAVDSLTINDELRLKAKIHDLETQHTHEWDSLKSEMNQMKQILDSLGLDLGTVKSKKEI